MRKYLLGIIVLLLVLCVTYIYFRNSKLQATQKFIESKYAKQLQLIELKMAGLSREKEWYENQIAAELGMHLQFPEILFATWSSDGSGGTALVTSSETFGRLPNYIPYGKTDPNHELFRGSTKNGVELVIYEGWVRDAEVIRAYTIYFDANLLQEKMNQE